jgi:ligand-binding SRPBCC domain-containing protein
MAVIRSRAWVAAPVDVVFAFFDDPANLARLMPPPVQIRLLRIEPSPPQVGSLFEFQYGFGPIQRSWLIRLVERVENERFVDDTISGPMHRFHHSHVFTPARRGGTWIEDRIDYHVGPDGPIGTVLDLAAGLAIRVTFVWRHVRQRRLLKGHQIG